MVTLGAPAKSAARRGRMSPQSVASCRPGLSMPVGTDADVLRRCIQLSSGLEGYQAGIVIGRTQQGPPHPFWALESGGHLPCCAYEGPIAMQNRQQLGGSCFIQNWQGPLSWLLHAHWGPGESRGARGPKEAPGSPQLQSGRKRAGGPPLPSPAVQPCLLPRQPGWGGPWSTQPNSASAP